MALELRDKLLALAEPLLTQLGYELVDLEFAPGRHQAMVRIFIDHADGVGVDDCERVSREFSALMDVEDPIPQAYTLEVSSPGMDRVLRIAAHFERFVGQRVHVELKLPRDGRKRYTGSLRRADASGIELEVDGTAVTLGYAEIAKARLVPEWPENKARRR
ncbi:MAG: ribosome maturation factor RimP [Steroidobacteraceae bacterium]